jgi:hypothetical protein
MAVWQIPPQFMTAAHTACDQLLTSMVECVIGQMAKAGAPADAADLRETSIKKVMASLGS